MARPHSWRTWCGLDRAAAGHHQGPHFPDGAVAVLGHGLGVTGQHGAGGCLGIDWVVLALAAPPGAVGPVDLDHVDAVAAQVLGKPVAIAAGASTPAVVTWP
jgi:hypothetical protein